MKKRKNKIAREKKPTLFRQIVEIHYEEMKAKRALRLLSSQRWSLEFLEYLCQKCAKAENKPVELTIVDKDGRRIILRSREGVVMESDEDILMHLDNSAMVNDFIRRNSK